LALDERQKRTYTSDAFPAVSAAWCLVPSAHCLPRLSPLVFGVLRGILCDVVFGPLTKIALGMCAAAVPVSGPIQM
jgi:hypothetical protein